MVIKIFTKGTQETASSYFRAYLMGLELEKRGHKIIFYPPPILGGKRISLRKNFPTILGYARALFSREKDQIIFLQRTIRHEFFIGIVLCAKLLFRPKIIFDFDDAIFLKDGNEGSRRRFLKTFILTKISNAVIVGGHFLGEWAERHNKNVHIIPTSIPFREYKNFSKDNYSISEFLHIGWTGAGNAHIQNLKMLLPVFEELIRKGISFRFTLIGAQKNPEIYRMFEMPGLNKKIIDWIDLSKRDELLAAIKTFDVGVMPLQESYWSKGKCAFKAIEYMACGVPTICSPVGENKILIKNGENGFLASDTCEWTNSIKSLAHSKALRERIGKGGQETIYHRYSVERNVMRVEDIMKSVLGR